MFLAPLVFVCAIGGEPPALNAESLASIAVEVKTLKSRVDALEKKCSAPAGCDCKGQGGPLCPCTDCKCGVPAAGAAKAKNVGASGEPLAYWHPDGRVEYMGPNGEYTGRFYAGYEQPRVQQFQASFGGGGCSGGSCSSGGCSGGSCSRGRR